MQGYRVYGTDGISATLVGNAGGVGAKTGLYFIDQSNHDPKITDTARCLTARYTAGMTNHTAMNSAVLEVHSVLTPERMEKRQNGRRMKEDGEPMFTLTSQDRHGVYVCEKVDSVKVKAIFPLQTTLRGKGMMAGRFSAPKLNPANASRRIVMMNLFIFQMCYYDQTWGRLGVS